MSGGFDVALAIQRIATVFWHDFAAIVLLGFAMVTVPQVALAVAGSHAGSTVIATFGGLLRALYVVIVSHGALSRLAGKPLAPRAFVQTGFAASPRALSPALLQGAVVVLLLVGLLLAGLTGAAAVPIRVGLVVVAFAGTVLTVAAVPLALRNRITPLAALGRAAALTRGVRSGVAVTLGLIALAIVPTRLVVAATVYGVGASTAQMAAIDATMTLASPGLWLLALFDLIAWGVAAVVPAAVFAGLRSR